MAEERPDSSHHHRHRHHHHHHHHHQHTVAGEIPVPHGPTVEESSSTTTSSDNGSDHGNDDTFMAGATSHERRIFSHVTRPDDSYTEDGIYWADLPWYRRMRFVSQVDREAAKQELAVVGRMMKKDPLSPVSWYFRNAVIPGAGLGLEGYVLFSIGNLEPLFAKVWPACWEDNTVCRKNWVASVTYLEIIGIMVGQAGVGVSLFFSFSHQKIQEYFADRWQIIDHW